MGINSVLPESSATASLRLDSWKEIASYLRRDIRTVQLWEKKEALPVHRHVHMARASVYAYSVELDAWGGSRRFSATRTINSLDPQPALPDPERAIPAVETVLSKILRYDKYSRVAYAAAVAYGLVLTAALVAITQRLRVSITPHLSQQALVQSATATAQPVLVVLPFQDLSYRTSKDYLADGLTNDLTTEIGRSNKLRVISSRSATRFKNTQIPLEQIASSLHANLLLEGAVAYSGKQMHVTVHLIDAQSERSLWAGSYKRTFDNAMSIEDNVLSAQDDVADEAAAAVIEHLTGDASEAVRPTRPTDPDVRMAYLMGRYFWNKRDQASLQTALNYFEQAIKKDAAYAPAYSGIADCYILWGPSDPRQTFPQAKAAALKAVELDPTSAEAYTSLALITSSLDWDFAKAEKQFQEAIQLNPSYAVAHQWYGLMLGDLGKTDQSINEIKQAVQLDPLSPMIGSELAMAYARAGRYQEAVSKLQQMLAMNPDFVPAHLDLSIVYESMKEYGKAQAERTSYARLTGDSVALQSQLVSQEWAVGKKDDARRIVQSLRERSGNNRLGNFRMAQNYMRIGDKEDALACLEQSYKDHSWLMITLLVEPTFASLHNDQHFRSLVQRVGLQKR